VQVVPFDPSEHHPLLANCLRTWWATLPVAALVRAPMTGTTWAVTGYGGQPAIGTTRPHAHCYLAHNGDDYLSWRRAWN